MLTHIELPFDSLFLNHFNYKEITFKCINYSRYSVIIGIRLKL